MTQDQLEKRFPEFVGQAFGPPEVGLDSVNEPMIRHWCETMGDANPVYLDPAAAKASREEIERAAFAEGTRSLWADGVAKVAAGLTSVEELARVCTV